MELGTGMYMYVFTAACIPIAYSSDTVGNVDVDAPLYNE